MVKTLENENLNFLRIYFDNQKPKYFYNGHLYWEINSFPDFPKEYQIQHICFYSAEKYSFALGYPLDREKYKKSKKITFNSLGRKSQKSVTQDFGLWQSMEGRW